MATKLEAAFEEARMARKAQREALALRTPAPVTPNLASCGSCGRPSLVLVAVSRSNARHRYSRTGPGQGSLVCHDCAKYLCARPGRSIRGKRGKR